MDEADALEALSNVLTALAENTYDFSLHVQHINLATAAGLEDQVQDAREMMTKYWASPEDVWLPLIEAKEKALDLNTPEGIQQILDLYERAETDYLSIPILHRHVDFLISRHAQLQESGVVSNNPEDAFSSVWTRHAMDAVVEKGLNHMSRGSELWEAQRDWELAKLETASPEESIDNLHLDRLQQPHADHEQTFQSYSTFTTNYQPPQDYETLLVAASKLRSKAAKIYEWREQYESTLAQADYSLAAYNHYVSYERRARKPELSILSGIYERAVAEAAKRRFAGEAGAEDALASFWLGYADALRIHKADQDSQLSVLQRGLRSIPASGELWAKYFRFLESNQELIDAGQVESIPAAYERAISTGLFSKDPEQLVPLVLARASYEKRRIALEARDEEGALPRLYQLLENSIELVRQASKAGDPRYRLEKFLAHLHDENQEYAEAAEVWGDAADHYKTSYLACIAYTEALARFDPSQASRVFQSIANKDLDWPEAVWEAWIAHEIAHGSVTSLESSLDWIDRARARVNGKRAKEAERASYQAMQIAAEQQAAQVPVTATMVPTENGVGAMDVDAVPPQAETTGKRKAEESLGKEDSKKARMEESPQPLKRDRENCTVFVGELPPGTTEDDLIKLFKDCGKIREVKLTQLPNALVATVEFLERDSVPAALTKDKKRVHDQEIAVHMAWESTLYVTNFPEKADDAFVRSLFGKYANKECMQSVAKAALELHGQELEPGMPLSVLISNPVRKKERSDADADAKEVYVAGLSKFATKEDLQKLFNTYGTVKEIRMPTDAQSHAKGFAFVEFENERAAAAALNANNQELKNRRIAVTLADTRVRSRKREEAESGLGKQADIRSRSVRIRGLPAGAQEGLLQQELEKHAAVARVEVFTDKNEAVAELKTPADAGKLLLRPDPIVFGGKPLQISEVDSAGGPRASAAGPSAKGFVPRAALSRPRAGLGHKKKPAPVAAGSRPAPPAGPSQTPASGKGQNDFRNMLMGGK
ncbi:hypothetical protein EWM64_g2871 [Hericium alpestre]|uniref:RRM domain-containing protein n=1 Tax=Hericium alpestre TaxID=135208 RepID=A0A4Z0A318_9AGAM|nr:hypothetical protein EWM64_g2871 [Hericium alpestre]